MKKTVLLLGLLLPCFLAAQSPDKKERKQKKMIENFTRVPSHPSLRSWQPESAPRDSSHIYMYMEDEKVFIGKTIFEYDNRLRLISEEHQFVDGSENKIVYRYKEPHAYPVEENSYVKEGNEWIETEKSIYDLNENGYPLLEEQYVCKEGEWFKWSSTRAVQWNDQKNPVILMDTTFHDFEDISVMKIELMYNSADQLVTFTTMGLSEEQPSGQEWELYEKILLEYDSQGCRTAEIHYSWDEEEEDWIYSDRIDMTYDDKKNLISMIEWVDKDFIFEKYEYVNFYSDDVSTSTEVIREETILLHFSDHMLTVTLQSSESGYLSVYSTSGKLVRRTPLTSALSSVSLHELNKGIYIIHVQTASDTLTKKIVIR